MKTVALDLGGTRIKIGVIEGNTILASSMIEAFSTNGLRARLPSIEEAIFELLRSYHIPLANISGIGISIPGIVDSRQKKVLSVNQKYFDSVGFDFVQWAREKFGLPIYVENDARSALVGEWRFGAGVGCDNIVMVTLGTGVGGAAIIEGKLLHGRHYQAGCLGGHFTINYVGQLCNCGNVGCVETEASSWSLPQQAMNDPDFQMSLLSRSGPIDYEKLFASAKRNDVLSGKLLHNSLLAWGSCVVNLIHAYDPEMVIISGGIMRSADIILPFLRKYVDSLAWTPWGKVKIVLARETDNAALLGISDLLHENRNVQ
jgi:glucokinase